MTATLSASTPLERSLRMLPISANLLPPEVSGSRRTRKIRLVAISAVAALLAMVGAGYGLARYQTAAAEADVVAAQDQTARLRIQQNSFKELGTVQRNSAAIEAELAALMKNDQNWADVVAGLQAALPAKTTLTVVNVSANGEEKAGAPAAAAPPNTSGQVIMGTVRLSGEAPDKAAIAEYMTNLHSAKGIANALLRSAVLDETTGHYAFTVDADATTKVASTRFTGPKTASKGAK
jgi:Tfp pilus assembly protein PilN